MADDGETVRVPVEIMNALMRSVRAAAEPLLTAEPWAPELKELLSDGFEVRGECVYFARHQARIPRVGGTSTGPTGDEHHVNKLHLDDLIDTAEPEWMARCVAQGVLLGRRVLGLMHGRTVHPIDVVIGADAGHPDGSPSAVFEFHSIAPGDWSWSESRYLDQVTQPLLVIHESCL